jgi:hypothetical protein
MDERLARKFYRHAREGVTYPNAGGPALTTEQQRFELKMARHKAAAMAEQALEEATKPEPVKAEPESKAAKVDDKAAVSKRG